MTIGAAAEVFADALRQIIREEIRAELRDVHVEIRALRARIEPPKQNAPLTFKEACAALRCSDGTLRTLLRKGLIRRMKIHNSGSSRVLIARSEIDRFLAESRQP